MLDELERLNAAHDVLLLMVDAAFRLRAAADVGRMDRGFRRRSRAGRQVLSHRELGELGARVAEWQERSPLAHARAGSTSCESR